MMPDEGALDQQIRSDKSIKDMRNWFKAGKPKDKFDPVSMGLDMLTLPTKHFGWKGITATMKKVPYLGTVFYSLYGLVP